MVDPMKVSELESAENLPTSGVTPNKGASVDFQQSQNGVSEAGQSNSKQPLKKMNTAATKNWQKVSTLMLNPMVRAIAIEKNPGAAERIAPDRKKSEYLRILTAFQHEDVFKAFRPMIERKQIEESVKNEAIGMADLPDTNPFRQKTLDKNRLNEIPSELLVDRGRINSGTHVNPAEPSPSPSNAEINSGRVLEGEESQEATFPVSANDQNEAAAGVSGGAWNEDEAHILSSPVHDPATQVNLNPFPFTTLNVNNLVVHGGTNNFNMAPQTKGQANSNNGFNMLSPHQGNHVI